MRSKTSSQGIARLLSIVLVLMLEISPLLTQPSRASFSDPTTPGQTPHFSQVETVASSPKGSHSGRPLFDNALPILILEPPSDTAPDQTTLRSTTTITHDLSIANRAQLAVYGADASDWSGYSLDSGDVNGDGRDDLVVGVQSGDGPGNARFDAGEVHVLLGRTTITGTAVMTGEADLVIYGADMMDYAGYDVATGDLNGDGLADIIIGAYKADGGPTNARSDAGDVYVVLGQATISGTVDLGSQADWVLYGATGGDEAGTSVAAGDVNGDSKDDIIIGAPHADGLGDGRLDSGEAYVVLGRATIAGTLDLSSAADWTLYGPQAGDQSGSDVLGGDLDNDGQAEVIVGAHRADGPSDGRTEAGDAYVVQGRGTVNGTLDLATDADGAIYGADAHDWIGEALSSGDVDGDGYTDLVIGTPYGDGLNNQQTDAGEVYLILGGETIGGVVDLATQADMTIYGAEQDDSAGRAVAVGDVSSDGLDDILIGAESADGPGNVRLDAGEAYAILGQASGLTGTYTLSEGVALTVYGVDDEDRAGHALVQGDFDGNDIGDLVIGAHRANGEGNGNAEAGDAYVVSGIGPDLRLVTSLTASPDSTSAGHSISAQFTVQNIGEASAAVPRLFAQAQGASGCRYPFPNVRDLDLAPGESYTYEQTRILYKSDVYTAQAGYYDEGWHTLPISTSHSSSMRGTAQVTHTAQISIAALSYPPQKETLGEPPGHCGEAGEPVNTAIGNYYARYTDLHRPGVGLDLVLARTYNSLDADQESPFGYGWAFNYDIFVSRHANDTVVVRTEDGKRLHFVGDFSGHYTPTHGLFDQLTRGISDTYVLTRPNQVVYRFNQEGRLNEIADPDGNRQAFFYDGGRLIQIVDTHGLTHTLSYSGHLITRVDAADGAALRYTYNVTGELTHFTDAEGAVVTYTYDAQHRMLTTTDPLGREYLDNTYDDQGRVIRQRDANDVVTTFTYTDSGTSHTIVFRDALGQPLTHTYNISGQLIYEQDALGYVMTRTYDADNNLLAVRDKNGHVTRYTYDARGNRLSKTDPLGHRWTYTYDARNNPLSETDPLGHTTRYTYDDENHLLTVTDRLSGTRSYVYNPAGLVVQRTDENGATTFTAYNEHGQPVTVTNALGQVTAYTYDDADNIKALVDAEGQVATYAYDDEGRMRVITDPLDYTTVFTYNQNGNLIAERNSRGNTRTWIYDENENIIRETEWAGHAVTYTYDAAYRKIRETDALGYTAVYTYDAVGNLIARQNKGGYVTAYTYDGNGNMLSTTDPLGHVIEYRYDALNRLVETINGCTICGGRMRRSVYNPLGWKIEEIDGRGNATAYDYDALGRTTVMTDALGHTTVYTYDTAGNLIAEQDALGHVTRYDYDLIGQRITTTNPLGHTVVNAYDQVGRLIATTDARGLTTRYAYDANDNRTVIIDALGYTTTFTYDGEGKRLGQTDVLDRRTTYGYDANGNLITETDPISGTTLYAYDKLGRQVAVTDPNGHLTTYGYNRVGQLVTRTLPGGQVTIYGYDAVGNQISETNALGFVTTRAYDAWHQRVRQTDPLGHVTRYGYDANGNLITETDTLSHTTLYGYDALNRLTVVTDAVGGTTHYTYDVLSNLVRQQDAVGHVTTFGYDVLSRPISETNPLGHTWRTTYDASGNPIRRQDPDGQTTLLEYDALNRLVKRTCTDLVPSDIATPTARFMVTPTVGYTTTVFTFNATASDDGQDPPALLKARWDWNNDGDYDTAFSSDKIITHSYAITGVQTVRLQVQDTAGLTGTVTHTVTVQTWRSKGVTLHLPLVLKSASSTRAWDIFENRGTTPIPQSTPRPASGLAASQTTPQPNVPQATPTPQSPSPRRTPVPSATPTSSRPFTSETTAPLALETTDPATRTVTVAYAYDAMGNRVAMTDSLGISTYAYNELNRLVTSIRAGRRVEYGYDPVGNLAWLRYPDGQMTRYTYDANDRLEQVTGPDGQPIHLAHDNLGATTAITYPNQAGIHYVYDSAGRLVQVCNHHPVLGNLACYTYTLDGIGNKQATVAHYASGETITDTYRYDPLYRLTDSQSSDGRENHYVFDAVGNRVRRSGKRLVAGQPVDLQIDYAYNAANQLVRATDSLSGTTVYTYSAGGNRIGTESTTTSVEYLYDAADRLRQVTVYHGGPGNWAYHEGQREFYTYDGEHRRVQKVAYVGDTLAPAGWRTYVYDAGWNVLQEDGVEEGIPNSARYVYGKGMNKLAVHASGDVAYFHYDGLGSVVGHTDGDWAGPIRYGDYGALHAGAEALRTDYSYTGHERDAYSGLIYAKNRYYDPVTGVWLTLDTFRGTPQEPSSRHRYMYVLDNPVNLTDPDGRSHNPILQETCRKCRISTAYEDEFCREFCSTGTPTDNQDSRSTHNSSRDRASEWKAIATRKQNCSSDTLRPTETATPGPTSTKAAIYTTATWTPTPNDKTVQHSHHTDPVKCKLEAERHKTGCEYRVRIAQRGSQESRLSCRENCAIWNIGGHVASIGLSGLGFWSSGGVLATFAFNSAQALRDDKVRSCNNKCEMRYIAEERRCDAKQKECEDIYFREISKCH